MDERPTVLVVDDIPENIDVLAGSLASDYRTKVALNGLDALSIAASEERPDLILLDVNMPDMDGYEVCKRLKSDKKTMEIPVLFVTAMDDEKDELKGFNAGAVDYITKPVCVPIVKARVQAQLELKKYREEAKKQNQILKENIGLKEDVDMILRHDLKSPLNIFLWAPDMLIAEGNLTNDQIETLQIMKKSTYNMLNLINNSINLLKMERGLYSVTPQQVDLIPILKQIQNELGELAQSKKVETRVLQNTEAFTIMGEEILFYNMLSNLIKNAVEASPKNGTISINLIDEESVKHIKITNIGFLSDSIRDKFFNKYISGKKNKTGLGTHSAKVMAETLRGSITVYNQEEATVTVEVSFPENNFSMSNP